MIMKLFSENNNRIISLKIMIKSFFKNNNIIILKKQL